jgi:hypothetical protein
LSHCRRLSHRRCHCWSVGGCDLCTDSQVEIWVGQ